MNNDLLRVFETESDYDSAKPDFVYPTVSYVRDVDEVRYMEKPLRNYFFVEALADGMTVTLNNTRQMPGMDFSFNAPANELEYSTDQQVWRRLPNNIASPTINTGERIYLRGNATSAFDMTNMMMGIGFFNISRPCNVGGNIMSLLFNDNFEDKTDLTGYDAPFANLFTGQPIVNASELLLPATTLSMGCYSSMFMGCKLLTTAPALPATTLATSCYGGMFQGCTSLTTAPALPATTLADNCYTAMCVGCSNLNYIKMLATDISASDCLDSWVGNVSSTGTFVKDPALSEETIGRGDNGIPEGWTVVDYSAPGTYLPDYDTTGLATHFVVDEVYANVLPLYQTIYDQYGDTHIDVATSMLEYINENDENVQIYIGNEPLYQNYLSKLTFAMSNDGTSKSPNYIHFSIDGLRLYNSNTSNEVIIQEGFGQCVDNTME